jgi:Ca2+-binding EF-hand superfamily protein
MLSEFRDRKLRLSFKFLDVNGDGRLSQQDFEQCAVNFGKLYGVGPGVPEYDEVHAHYMNYWDQVKVMDTDDDGEITLDEYVASMESWLSHREAFMSEMAKTIAAWYEIVDRDKDGILSEDELVLNYRISGLEEGAARKAFRMLDSEGRGGITRDEMVAFTEEMYYAEDPEARGNWIPLSVE